ncbi:MarR family winged helix-turn-helix transcriptional regulator [Nocardia fluminea]|uniref:MarR family winged helix-turn-helix transcriptional regulator n=1 Tax=Nocardia fluminea TaxID=134984 RepID=UPI00366A6FD0
MNSRTAVLGIAVPVIGAGLLLTGCSGTTVETGPPASSTVAAATTTQSAPAPGTLTPSIIGRAEKHHTAVLGRALTGTTLDEKQWIVLNQVTDEPVERTAHINRIAGLTQWAPAEVETALNALLAKGLLANTPHGRLEPTTAGKAVVGEVRAESDAIVAAAYGAVTPEDLATTARVLATITARMAQELTHG